MNSRGVSIGSRAKGAWASQLANALDWQIVFWSVTLCLVGLALLYSAGHGTAADFPPQVKRQAISMGFGFSAFAFCAFLPPRVWHRWSYIIYSFCVLLLVLILVIGESAGGAQRWISFGSLRVQPSEFMKVGLILALARYFSSKDSKFEAHGFLDLIVPLLIIAVPAGLTLVQPDLGTALCQVLIALLMLFVAGVKRGPIVAGIFVFLGAAYPLWSSLKDYQKKRILSFLDPSLDPLGSGYHATQSKIAVGSGSITGKGFLEGTQTQLRFLPEQTTDFIFSVLAEEWGFIGTTIVLSLYGFLLFRLCGLALKAEDSFGRYLAVGAAGLIFWHTIINVGMVVGLMPVVGLTLPLISFGGSSVLSVLAALGLAAGASGRRMMFLSRF